MATSEMTAGTAECPNSR